MEIKITNGRWWYSEFVGEVFQVEEVIHDYDDEGYEGITTAYKVKYRREHAYILEEDSEIVADGLEPGEALGVLPGTYQDIRSTQQTVDMVNSPGHYTTGKFEVIEIIEEVTKGYEDPFMAYCVGNAQKYIARAPHKGKLEEDLEKAAKYIEFALGSIRKES
ncbi:DUF3310 domain-containing protein [Rossellomorea marisflavi]|uniref:DUF3310 domain-containing protein n=1 Tax=Rossellomorea marisflavi TaxID=189381 RepID=UPI00215B973E|nr:DUF3310 domain-containing protein [Rossellomorea marisflavi]